MAAEKRDFEEDVVLNGKVLEGRTLLGPTISWKHDGSAVTVRANEKGYVDNGLHVHENTYKKLRDKLNSGDVTCYDFFWLELAARIRIYYETGRYPDQQVVI